MEIPRDYNPKPIGAPDAPLPAIKRWPFHESPGEFAERLAKVEAINLLAAIRTVLIEQPPQLSREYLNRVLAAVQTP